ncbi:MAG: hypothetical protein QXY45_03265 [Candidatus Aenigmatarchaeota archaeon]
MITEKEWIDLKRKEKILKEASKILSVEPQDLPRVIQRFLKEIEEMDQKLNSNF